jgi:alpha-aminoadipate carrier protein LysW
MWGLDTASRIAEKTIGGIGMVNCPVCDAVLDIEEDDLDEGDEFTCDECGADLAVVGTDPLEITSASEADEDEDDEDDLDEDDEDEDDELEDEEEDEDWK